MNHGFKLHPDCTLEITMPKGEKVGRVLVQEEMSQNGALYYREGDVPELTLCKCDQCVFNCGTYSYCFYLNCGTDMRGDSDE